jgi:type IV pilus biogenesis protein CpaD/CtpE
MTRIDHRSTLRRCLVVAAGLLAAGCSANSQTGRWIRHTDDVLTAKVTPSTSPYKRHPSAYCPEWTKLMGDTRIREDDWEFGCATTAGLVVSVSDKRDLAGGRRLRPSEGWEAVKVMTDDREGKLEPGKVDTSKSATTSRTK